MKIKKEIKEWVLIVALFGGLYVSGYYKDVASFLQRIIIETRLLQPSTNASGFEQADYNMHLLDETGQSVDFNTFRQKTVFLNFWATWCPPCMAEMPDIQALYNEVHSKDVHFVMISLDEDFAKAIALKEKKGYTFPIYQLQSHRPQVLQSQSIPTTYVLSPQGRIIARREGMAKYNTASFRNLLIKAAQTGKNL
ncbi:hypothetical protein BFP72_11255 [Reichenbachiella sp. 5M10]|uniref:TlpA family protein disulfide reductase n=1 Tax=Reichenbachiella sp. 5M10 TaxID=1889772 RepID=UPI000C5C9F98|nr:TlpA disulfide reductase family protein [Reichenbachiella sp. 5M10]PIB35929.1 hypothetical protein BFP72_11255 [Reichenbachiella sp. 5M10]